MATASADVECRKQCEKFWEKDDLPFETTLLRMSASWISNSSTSSAEPESESCVESRELNWELLEVTRKPVTLKIVIVTDRIKGLSSLSMPQ